MAIPLRVLIVEDSEDDTLLLIDELQCQGYDPYFRRVETAKEMIDALDTETWEVILVDYVLPRFGGPAALKICKDHDPDLPVIIVSGRIGDETGVEMMVAGADDYVLKDNLSRLVPAIRREVEQAKIRREAKLLERTILNDEQRYKDLVELLPYLVYEMDNRGVFTFINQNGLNSTGYTPEDMARGISIFDVVIPEESDTATQQMNALLKGEKMVGHEFAVTRKDGSTFPIMGYAAPIQDDGEITGIRGVAVDITDRKQTEQSLAESESRFRLMTEKIKDVFWMTPPNIETIIYVSPAYEKIWGRSCESLYAAPLSFIDAIHPDDRARVMDVMDYHSSHEIPWNVTYRIIRPDGSLRWIEDRGFPFYDNQGNYLTTGVAKDITEHKLADDTIKASLKEKELLLREIHHRVKNNLQIMSSLLALQSAHIKDNQYIGMFNEARNRITAMAVVHENLYRNGDFTRIKAREQIWELTGGLLSSYDVSGSGISLKRDIEDVSFPIDIAVPFGLIINELMSNCLKHAFPNKGSGEIMVSLKSTGRDLFELVVRDNGVGMAKDYDVERSDSFGLYLVGLLAKQIHGAIEIVKGHGTEIRLKFGLSVKHARR